jgi:hypothetical protein
VRFSRRLTLTFVAFTLALSPVTTFAATGVAYDSVTKFSIGQGDGSAPAPGTFSADFQAASSAEASASNTPKMPFGLGKMMAKAQAAIATLKSGTAEKHYIGATKERIDNVAEQTGDITDCTARTITHLDLAKKTYSVESLDHPMPTAAPATSHASAPGPAPTDDGTKIAIDLTTKSLGPMTIDGVATTGYNMNIKMTATKPTGESSTINMLMTAYYSAMPDPSFSCPRPADYYPAGAPQNARGASMAMYGMMMQALSTKGSSRFKITNSGPSIPFGKLAMWTDTQMVAPGAAAPNPGAPAGGFSIISERGDIKTPLADNDQIFSIPAGFTKV